jgi:hypothetical protein
MMSGNRIYPEVILIHRNLVRNYQIEKENGVSLYYAEIFFFFNKVRKFSSKVNKYHRKYVQKLFTVRFGSAKSK